MNDSKDNASEYEHVKNSVPPIKSLTHLFPPQTENKLKKKKDVNVKNNIFLCAYRINLDKLLRHKFLYILFLPDGTIVS